MAAASAALGRPGSLCTRAPARDDAAARARAPADAVTRAGHAVNRTKLPQPVPVKVRASPSPAVGLSGRDGTRRERFASLRGSAAPTLD